MGLERLISKRKPFCKDYILELLREKDGKATRGELRPYLIEKGYGTEGIRQAYLSLIRSQKIFVEGSSRSQNQMVILNERNEK